MPKPKKLTPYAKMLLDPRWQKKRLDVLSAAGWKCGWCGSSTRTLHVHHGYYRPKAAPWDYEDRYLHCLCDRCHEKAEFERLELYRAIAMLPPAAMLDLFPAVLAHVQASLPALPEPEPDPEPEIDPAMREEASDDELDRFFESMRSFLDE